MAEMREGEHTIGRWLRESADVVGENIAIDDRGLLMSYADLHVRATKLAARMTEAGFGKGHRIATLTGNTSDQVVVFFACALNGMALAPLSWRLTPNEIASLLMRIDPALVLVEEDYASLAHAAFAVQKSQGQRVAPVTRLGTAGVEASVPSAYDRRDSGPAADDDPLLVICTSGSESAPKPVVLTQANCFWTNHALSRAAPIQPDDVVLAMMPQHHVAAWNVQPLLAWSLGATVVLERSFDAGRILQLIDQRRVTTMMGVPTQYRMLVDHKRFTECDLSSVRMALAGGGSLSQETAERWCQRAVPLTHGYGLTEAGPNVMICDSAHSADHPGAVGRPYPSVDVRIVDQKLGLELAGEATGELQVRGPAVMREYLGSASETERVFDDGWLRTGDLVRRDADGMHWIVDRVKDIIISGGENISPSEVEAAIVSHPLVAAVAVVGAPDPVWGERGVAFVQVHAPVSDDELFAHARQRLASFKLPVRIVRVAELPTSALGKVQRTELKRQAQHLVESA